MAAARLGSTAAFGPPDELVARRKHAFKETDVQTHQGRKADHGLWPAFTNCREAHARCFG